MDDRARLQDKMRQISLLKQKLAKLNPAIDEQAAKRELLKEQVTFEEFQTVWNGAFVASSLTT